jgi:exosortase
VNLIQNYCASALDVLRNASRTIHGRVVLCSAVVGLAYLPSWLRLMTMLLTTTTITTPLVSIGAAGLGIAQLWQIRHTRKQNSASAMSRWVGYGVIGFGIALFAVGYGKVWSHALVCSIVLLGIFLSSWGFRTVRQYWLSIFYVLLGIYPSGLTVVSGYLLKILLPVETLERFMAWLAGGMLQLLGYSAVSDGIFLLLPTGGVSVYEGCTGFDLLVSILCVSLLVGLSFLLSRTQTLVLSILGLSLTLGFNAIRIALMAIAVAEWGDPAFEFWHGFWGGQIFSGLLFTIYYYLTMWILPLRKVAVVR